MIYENYCYFMCGVNKNRGTYLNCIEIKDIPYKNIGCY